MSEKKGMYPETRTWNPFVGCRYHCIYCKNSFQLQVKRVAGRSGCDDCRNYTPHTHSTRLNSVPNAPIIFVCGTGDISFCDPDYVRKIFRVLEEKRPDRTYYFQSKNPRYFNEFLNPNEFPVNSVLLTTIETNRDDGYRRISQAPLPSQRIEDFFDLDYHKKVVTIEPVLDFDVDELSSWMIRLKDQGNLLYVWLGYESKGTDVPTPIIKKSQEFVDILVDNGIEVRGKSLEISKTWKRRFDGKVKLREMK